MTQELLDLRVAIQSGRTSDALLLVDELEEMSRQSRILNIESYLERMLVHLIKNQAEQRLPRSWMASIRDSVIAIARLNLQDNKKAHYIRLNEWDEYLEFNYQVALAKASDEAFDGRYMAKELAERVDSGQVYATAMRLLALTYTYKNSADLMQCILSEVTLLPGS